ncbi:hypothetical protein Tco_1124807 [Tanacetum coccineum]|uniref:Uncharacterized protein n=1 Tax=Tanacetum coccineum TaxID=301880 RepID=A0ABQ5J767_9ASTR
MDTVRLRLLGLKIKRSPEVDKAATIWKLPVKDIGMRWDCRDEYNMEQKYGSAAYSSLGYGDIGNWGSRFFGKGLGSLSYGSANLNLGFGYFRDVVSGFWKCNTIYIIDKGFNMFGMDCGPSGYMYSVRNNVLISSGLPLSLGSMMVLVTRWTQDFCLYFGPRLLNVEDLQVMIIYRIKYMVHWFLVNAAVHKELGNSLVRAATTASSLEAEQDSGNITKTRSKATPNESSSLGTTSGGGPRCQETMRDTIAQTRFENVSKHSNDSLLARSNTLRNDEDSLKLNELMELCTNLQQRVLDLEKTKTTQQNKITSLKRMVKKLEQKKRSRTHGLKRLHKVGMSRRVESSGDEEDLVEDASKQERRINTVDFDEDITLVNVQHDADNEIFDVDTLSGDEVFAEQEVAVKGVNLTIDEVTLAQALAALKRLKPRVKEVVIEEPSVPVSAVSASIKAKVQDKGKGKMVEPKPMKPTKKKVQIMLNEEIILKLQAELVERLQAEEQEQFIIEEKATLFKELLEQRRKHFAAKRAEEKRNKPPTKTQQKKTMITYLKNMEDLVEGSSKRAGEELEQESTKNQKVDEDKDTTELQSLMEVIPDEEEVAIDAVPLATKSPKIVGCKIHKEGKKSYYQIMRADGKPQMYRIFSQMIKSFDREDLEDLRKLVKSRYGSTRPVEDLDLVLWNDLKTMFEPHVEDEI